MFQSVRSLFLKPATLIALALFSFLVSPLAFSQASYEGQIVSSITVIADPRLDVARFRSLVTQEAGKPYSASAVEASKVALQQAGNFPKVWTDVEPETAGLHLSFVLEPAYYVGVASFPGATKLFRYTRLLQVINFQDESPYDKSQLPGQEKLLLDFFRNNGFFAAQVRGGQTLDEAHHIANPVFEVNLGKRARIGNVIIRGGNANENARLLHSVQGIRARASGGLLKTSKTYTSSRIKNATSLLKASLTKRHYLANRITFESPQYHPETNRVDILVAVEVGPTVDVKTSGAKVSFLPYLSNRQVKKLVPVYSEGSVDRDLVDEGARNLNNYFQKKGYFDSQVTTNYQNTPGKVTVAYNIDKGRKHKLDNVIFSGNHQVSSAELNSGLTIKKHTFLSRGLFSQKLLTASAKNIQTVYRDRGFEDVKVTPSVVDHEPKIDVKFAIVEGTKTIVDNVLIQGDEHVPIAALTPPQGFTVLSGTAFSPGRVSKDRGQILAHYLNRGFLNVDVKTKITRHSDDPHRVDVAFLINEHQQVNINDVVLVGQEITRPQLISETADISPETPLSQGKLLQAQSELYNLGIFDWSSVGPEREIFDQSDETALLKVHEAKRNIITYGFGFEAARRGGSVPSGTVAIPGLPVINTGTNNIVPSQATFVSPRGSIEYTRRNIRGLGETGQISALAARLDQRALISYTDPRFRNTRWNALTTFSLERTTENPLFAARLGDASFQLERTLNQANTSRLQIRYDFNKTRLSQLLVPELVLEQDRNVRLSTLSATFIKDTRDKPLDAHRGVFSTLNLGITPTAFGSSANFGKFFGQYSYYRPMKGLVWANSVRLGLAKPFSGSFVPTSQLFFTGGGNTIRGFPLNGAGPQRLVPFCAPGTAPSACTSLITVPIGGRQLFILNSELRFPLHIPIDILKPLGAVAFYDGGNVYRRINFNDFVNSYTNTVGVGLRYATPIGPVRIDLGRNLNPVPGVGSTQYFITLGQSF